MASNVGWTIVNTTIDQDWINIQQHGVLESKIDTLLTLAQMCIFKGEYANTVRYAYLKGL